MLCVSSFWAHPCYKQIISANLIISAACSGVRSSTATLLIFTSWSPGTSRPSAGPPAHTKTSLCCHISGCLMGLSLSTLDWLQAAACVPLCFALLRCVLLIQFSSHTKAESFIQSISVRPESNQCRYGRLTVSVCTLPPASTSVCSVRTALPSV